MKFNQRCFYITIRAYMGCMCVFLYVVFVPDILSAIIYDSWNKKQTHGGMRAGE
jgi:hypothetical protein